MKTRELVELAALAAAHGETLMRGDAPVSPAALQEYWSASKSRLNRWGHSLRKYQRELDYLGPRWARLTWRQAIVTIEEIFASEVLARVWTAVLTAHDRHHRQHEAEPIARSIFVGHLEARNRAMRSLAAGHSASDQAIVRLNRLRQQCERWADMLLAYVADEEDRNQLAIDAHRADDFAASIERQRRAGLKKFAWQITVASLRSVFDSTLAGNCTSPDLNTRIAASILCCFPPELFDAIGPFSSVWLMRLQTVSLDAAGMIEQLVSLEMNPPTRRRFYG